MKPKPLPDEYRSLIEVAKIASTYAYAPYSGYNVGVALLCKNNDVYDGCNIENASYPASICAERVAISKAVSNGETDFSTIVIYCNSETLFAPCGICRQVMAEFSYDMMVVYANDTQAIATPLADLLPDPFILVEGDDHKHK